MFCTFHAGDWTTQTIKLARTAVSVARTRRNDQTQIPQSFGAAPVHRLRNRVILGRPSQVFVHHIHEDGVCFVWQDEEQQYYATREWGFLTVFEQELVDYFVSSLRARSLIQ